MSFYFQSTLEFKVQLPLTLSKLFPARSEHTLEFHSPIMNPTSQLHLAVPRPLGPPQQLLPGDPVPANLAYLQWFKLSLPETVPTKRSNRPRNVNALPLALDHPFLPCALSPPQKTQPSKFGDGGGLWTWNSEVLTSTPPAPPMPEQGRTPRSELEENPFKGETERRKASLATFPITFCFKRLFEFKRTRLKGLSKWLCL